MRSKFSEKEQKPIPLCKNCGVWEADHPPDEFCDNCAKARRVGYMQAYKEMQDEN